MEGPQGHGLFRVVAVHPVAVSMAFMAALVFGWVSYQRLPIELMPDISYPTLTVRTAYEGAAPQEVETQISQRIEEELATLDGLVHMESRSRAGSSDVVLGFDWGTDMDGASQSIRESLQTTFLPREADRPLLLRYDPSLDPFVRLAVSATDDSDALPREPAPRLETLRHLADGEIKRKLEAIPGVAAARVKGGLEPEIRIEVREDWLAARKITLSEVKSALASENVNVAGGAITEGDLSYLIRTLNEYTTVDELRTLSIRRSDGVQVLLTDVANVRADYRERDVITRLDSGEAVEIEVFKEAGANVVEVAHALEETLNGGSGYGASAGLVKSLPPGVQVTVLDNQASFIEMAVRNLRNTAVLGGLFAVGVLFLFLRDFRSTAIIGLAIPVSVVIGFAPLYLLDVSLNLMSLGGLALGVGMLVDNAVVVLESIQRFREEGLSRVDAAVRGVGDVAIAVSASTLTTVAVFFPISFVEGVAGELFGDLSLAVVSSLIASLAVALFAVPMLAALQLPTLEHYDHNSLVARLPRQPHQSLSSWTWSLVKLVWTRSASEPWAELKEAWRQVRARKRRILWLWWPLSRIALHAVYGLLLSTTTIGTALSAQAVVRVGRLFILPGAWAMLAAAGRFQTAYNLLAERYRLGLRGALARPTAVLGVSILLLTAALGGARLLGTELIPELDQGRFTIELALPVATPLARTEVVLQEAEARVRSHPGVQSVYAVIGVDPRADARADEGEHTARLRVQLEEGADEGTVMEDLRQRLTPIPRLEAKMVRPVLFSFKTPVEVVVFGYDLDELRSVGGDIADGLGRLESLRDVRSSLVDGHPEIRINYDRTRLHRLGLDAATVAERVRDKIQGAEATRIRQGDRTVGLNIQLIERDRASLEELLEINVNPNLVPAIPLASVANFEEAIGPSEIRRVDQQRAVVISANLAGFDLGRARSDIDRVLRQMDLPEDVNWTIAGQSKEMEASLASLRFALALAVFLVYVIMASTFENLVHPFVILFSVPLAIVGAVGGLLLSRDPISVVVLIGIIVLSGVVVNNAIVLVDTINRLRAEGAARDAAIARAAQLRLRPILITTFTTVLGLAPLALGFGAGAEMQRPLAITVIGGLSSSTLLTLVVIPVVYRAMARERATAPPPPAVGGEVLP